MFLKFRSAWRNKQRRKWEKKRRRGKQSFVLYYGVLKWGGIMFVLTNISNVLARHQKLEWHSLVSLLIACPVAGYVWARCTWAINEERFYGARKQESSIKQS